jgi:hypothetical protein
MLAVLTDVGKCAVEAFAGWFVVQTGVNYLERRKKGNNPTVMASVKDTSIQLLKGVSQLKKPKEII